MEEIRTMHFLLMVLISKQLMMDVRRDTSWGHRTQHIQFVSEIFYMVSIQGTANYVLVDSQRHQTGQTELNSLRQNEQGGSQGQASTEGEYLSETVLPPSPEGSQTGISMDRGEIDTYDNDDDEESYNGTRQLVLGLLSIATFLRGMLLLIIVVWHCISKIIMDDLTFQDSQLLSSSTLNVSVIVATIRGAKNHDLL